MKRLPWKRIAGAVLVAAAVAYLVWTIARSWDQLRAFDWEVDVAMLVASTAAHVAVLAWGVWVWGRVLRCFAHPPVGNGALQRIWFLSSLARYIPGKVFQFVAVAQLSTAAGLSGAVLLTSLVVHTGMALLSAMLLSAWTLTGPLFPALPPVAIGVAATVVCILLVHPAFLNAAIGFIPRLLKKNVIRWEGSWIDGVGVLALSVASWVLYGGAYYLFLASLTEIPASAIPMLSGVNALSFVIGYVSIVSPAGAGVREYAMTQLLLPLVPEPVGAVLSIASRLWTIAAELLGGALVLLLTRKGTASASVDGEAAAVVEAE